MPNRWDNLGVPPPLPNIGTVSGLSQVARCVFNIVVAIMYAWLPNDIELILGAIAKMHFIAVLCTNPLVADISHT